MAKSASASSRPASSSTCQPPPCGAMRATRAPPTKRMPGAASIARTSSMEATQPALVCQRAGWASSSGKPIFERNWPPALVERAPAAIDSIVSQSAGRRRSPGAWRSSNAAGEVDACAAARARASVAAQPARVTGATAAGRRRHVRANTLLGARWRRRLAAPGFPAPSPASRARPGRSQAGAGQARADDGAAPGRGHGLHLAGARARRRGTWRGA